MYLFMGDKMNDADGSKSDEERRDEGRPREINVLRFAKERVTQIAELLDVSELFYPLFISV